MWVWRDRALVWEVKGGGEGTGGQEPETGIGPQWRMEWASGAGSLGPVASLDMCMSLWPSYTM